jgi:Gpi18-like mannosyltransferase
MMTSETALRRSRKECCDMEPVAAADDGPLLQPDARRDRRTFWLYMAMLIAAAWLVRMLLALQYRGFVPDQRLFVEWMESVRMYGLGEAYLQNQSINYPPLFLFLMGIYGRFAAWAGFAPQAGALSFKYLLIGIDTAAILLAAKLTGRMVSPDRRAFVLVLFALNPALMADSAVWGQVDMLHSILMAFAVLLLRNRPWLSGMVYAAALLTKFQAVVIAPVFGVWLLLEWIRGRRIRPLLWWASGFAVPWAAAAAYFSSTGSLGSMVAQAYTGAVGFYTTATMNAMNIWFYVIGVRPDTSDTEAIFAGLTMRNLGFLLLFAAVVVVCVYMVIAANRDGGSAFLLKASALLSFAFFMLPTEIHERYSIPALVFAILLAAWEKRWTLPAALLTATILANLLIVLDNDVRAATGLWIAAANVLLLAWMCWTLGREIRRPVRE